MVIKKLAAYILLVSVYGFTWLVAAVAGLIPRRRWKPTGRIAVTGTFFNPNWYLSHITPLARSGVKEVILVVDEPQIPIEKVRFICPPKWIAKLISRAAAKAIWMLLAGIRYKPDLYMGYHLAPGACSALIAGKILGRPTCYQMTGGPVEIMGGGIGAVDSIGGSLGCPSKFIENLSIKVVKKFDLVVVRGNQAKDYFAEKDIKESVTIITGSVNKTKQTFQDNRTIHLVFVGRLSPIKQINQFIEIVANLAKKIPNIKAAIVGSGPLMDDMQKYVIQLGISKNVEFFGKQKNVESIFAKSKIFVLTSKSEGLSIAMAEAMVAGVVPVVSDIGELGDLVISGVNGFIVEPNNVNEHANKVMCLLQNDELWTTFSHKAIEDAKKLCDIGVVSGKWHNKINEVVLISSGQIEQDSQN